mgnify:CR=1 FL=1
MTALHSYACHYIVTAFYHTVTIMVTGNNIFSTMDLVQSTAWHGFWYQCDHKVATNQDFDLEFENISMHS